VTDNKKLDDELKKSKETPLTEEGLKRVLISILVVASIGFAIGAFIAKYIL
jgi:hypothetical protein